MSSALTAPGLFTLLLSPFGIQHRSEAFIIALRLEHPVPRARSLCCHFTRLLPLRMAAAKCVTRSTRRKRAERKKVVTRLVVCVGPYFIRGSFFTVSFFVYGEALECKQCFKVKPETVHHRYVLDNEHRAMFTEGMLSKGFL